MNTIWATKVSRKNEELKKDASVDLFEEAERLILLKASQVPPLNEITIGPRATHNPNNNYFGLTSLEPVATVEPSKNGVHPNTESENTAEGEVPNTGCTVTAAAALQGLEELRKAEVKNTVSRYIDKITFMEQQLQSKMNEELKLLMEEKQTKSRLKQKLIESSITEDDLVVSKMVSKMVEKYQQEKLKNEAVAAKEKEENEIRLRQERIAAIQRIYVHYRKVYDNINENIKECKNFSKFAEESIADVVELKTLNNDFTTICSKIKTSNIEDGDVETCNVIHERIMQIANKTNDKIEEINKQFLAEEAKQNIPAVEKETTMIEEVSTESKARATNEDVLSTCICKELHENYLHLKKKLEDTNSLMENLVRNNSLKKFFLHLKIAINTPLNAVSSANASHMQDKYNKISLILRGNFNYPTSGLTADMKDQYYSFCVDFLCKKFINQGENLISSKPEDAFPLASLILALWIEFHDFGELLLAHFMKKCPYIIPAYWPQFKGQSDKEYYMSLGYRYSANGTVEEHNMFLRRMNGILMLYTAIMILEPRHNKPHPYGIRYAWRWLAAILNLEPSPDITATLLHEFLKLAGFKLSQYYGIQFWKIIHFLYTEYYSRIDKVTPDDFRGPLSRLKEYLETVLRTRRFTEPKGILNPNFW